MRTCLVVILFAACSGACMAVPYVGALPPSGDTFVRAADPARNYGGAGGLAVDGAASANGQGALTGVMDSFIRFSAADFMHSASSLYGAGGWTVTGAILNLTEQAAPTNPMFGRGVGRFEIRWISDDSWIAGTGTPSLTTHDGLAYQDEAALLNLATAASLGIFTNSGKDGALALPLALPAAFVDDVRAGGSVTLFLTAVDDSIGLTFNSMNIPAPRLPPSLAITAAVVPEPGTLILLAGGLCAVAARISRRARH